MLAFVFIAPDYVLGLSVDQFQAQRQLFTSLDHAPIQNRLRVKLSAEHLRIRFLALVTKNGRTRFDIKIRQLRQTADKRFGHPVRQVIEVRVATGVYKWHYRDGLDRSIASS